MKTLFLSGLLAVGLASAAHAGDQPSLVFATVDGVAGAPVRAFSGIGTHPLVQSWTPFPNSVRTEMRFVVASLGPRAAAVLLPKNPAGTFQFNVFDLNDGQFAFQDNFTDPDFQHGAFPAVIHFQDRGTPTTGVFMGADGSYKIATSDENVIPVYPSWFRGGVRVAAGDLTGDGNDEMICAPGPGASLPVLVLSPFANAGPAPQFFPFGPTFRGGVNVAAGDLNGDGVAEIVTAASSGMGPQVRVFDASFRLIRAFSAYEASFTGGVRLSVADLNGDGRAEIITGNGPGRNPQIRVFNGNGVLHWTKSFMPTSSRAGIQVCGLSLIPG